MAYMATGSLLQLELVIFQQRRKDVAMAAKERLKMPPTLLCSLSTAYCLLLTAYCLLLTAIDKQ